MKQKLSVKLSVGAVTGRGLVRHQKQFAASVFLLIALCVLAMGNALAANKYLYANATGSGNGSDWNNAYTTLSALESGLARGDVGYVATGSYGSATFDTALSGTQQITIKKATAADHGTDTGWSPSYGTGQATLGRVSINVGCITLDGQYAYGFKIPVSDGSSGIYVGGSSALPRNNITIRYVDVGGPYNGTPHNYLTDTRCLEVFPYTGSTFAQITNLLVEYCDFHDVSTIIQIDQYATGYPNNVVFQYNKLHDNKEAAGYNSGTMAHQNLLYATNTRRIIFRYNEVWNTTAVGFYPSYNGGYHEIYGNVVRNCSSFVWIYESGSQPGIQYYNNTLSGVSMPYLDQMNLSTATVNNNIFYNCGAPDYGSNVGHDYNWYSGSSASSEANGVAGGSVNPFQSGTFVTVSNIGSTYPRNRGKILDATFNRDPVGATRGADGSWDIGAYEFSGVLATNPMAAVSPSSLNFGSTVTNTTRDLIITLQNVGAGTLAGTATVAAPFSIVSGATYSLGANQSQSVTIRYSPTAVGSSSLSVSFPGGSSVVTLPVSGVATVAAANLPPTVSVVSQNATDVDPNTTGIQVYEGSVVLYSGSASDPNSDPLTWQWIYSVNGGAEVIYRNGTGTVVPASFTYGAGTAGRSYVWKLRVNDGVISTESQLTVGIQTPPVVGGGLSFEAEAGVVSAPFSITGGYVSQSVETLGTTGGHVTFSFTITNAGNYVIQALVNAPNESGNSYFVNIDGEPQDPNMIWHIPLTSGFEDRIISWQGGGTWDNPEFVPKVFTLSTGTHQVIFRGREPNTQLDRFSILKLPSSPQNLRVVLFGP